MFENFGIRDVWSATKRYSFWILLLLILCIGAGSFYGYTNAQSLPDADSTTRDTYRAFYTFGVTSNDPDLSSNQAPLFVKLLRTDPAKNYVTDMINQTYTPEQLQSMLPISNLAEQPITPTSLLEHVQIKELQYTSSFAVLCDSFNQDLSHDVCQAYKNYIEQKLPQTVNDASATFLDQTVSVIPAGSRPADETALFGTETYSPSISVNKPAISTRDNIMKFAAFGLVAGLALAFVLMLAAALIRPTLNRKSDFAQYDVPVIAEIGKMGYYRR